jgi:hypothetical protein
MSDTPTAKLPEEPEFPIIDPNNIDWTTDVMFGRLEKVPTIYSQEDVNENLYSERSHILNIYTSELSSDTNFDLNRLRSKLVEYINDLLNDSAKVSVQARSVLTTDYNFVSILKPVDINSQQSLRNYQQERLVLIQALEQALTLIVSNPVLKNLVSTYILYNGQVPEETLSDLHALVRDAGLDIWIENTWNGFNNDPRNHGTLVFHGGKIRLNLDLAGRYSLQELVHEFAAYLIIKTKERNINSQRDLDNAKQVDLRYVLLMLDLLLANTSQTTRYTNLAGWVD